MKRKNLKMMALHVFFRNRLFLQLNRIKKSTEMLNIITFARLRNL